MPGGLQDGGRRKPWTVTIHKSRLLRLFPWLEDNDHRVRFPTVVYQLCRRQHGKASVCCPGLYLYDDEYSWRGESAGYRLESHRIPTFVKEQNMLVLDLIEAKREKVNIDLNYFALPTWQFEEEMRILEEEDAEIEEE